MKIVLGEHDITNLVLSGEMNSAERAEAVFKLRSDLNALKALDWTQWITISEGLPESDPRFFSGFVTNTSLEADHIKVSCADPHVLLDEARIGGGFGSGISIPEIIYYLVASVTPELSDPANISFGDGTRLVDQPLLFSQRSFAFIVPMPFLLPPSEPIQFLDGLIYAGDEHSSIDDLAIYKAFNETPPPEWQSGSTRLRFTIRASNFLEAFDEGRERLRKTLDLLSMAANFSSPTLPTPSGVVFVPFNRERLNVAITEPNWAFVRDNIPGHLKRHWLRWFASHLKSEPLALSDYEFFRSFEAVFGKMSMRSTSAQTSRDRSILRSVHALRRGRQAFYDSDALSLLWQSIEYLTAGFPVEPPVSEQLAKKLVTICVTEVRSMHKDKSPSEMDLMVKHVKRGMNLVRSLPLFDKWQALCAQLGISFSDEEEAALWGLRKSRNSDMHGSKSTAKRPAIALALNMVEKVAVAAAAAREAE